MTIVNVAMADLKLAKSPDLLVTVLGSCVGIALYDHTNKLGGLSHIMLPYIGTSSKNQMKYADSAIDLLIRMMLRKGAKKEHIIAKITGGANMYPTLAVKGPLEIGKRNVDAVKKMLKENCIDIIAEDLFGECGRSIEFSTSNGKILIKRSGKGDIII